MSKLPPAIQEFVARLTTLAVTEVSDLAPEDHLSPYGSYWYRAIAAICLAGRVKPAGAQKRPNRTDVNRVGKEANFNQYLFERIGHFLVAGKIIQQRKWEGPYEPGPYLSAFWSHDVEQLRACTQTAVLELAREFAGSRPVRIPSPQDARLTDLLALFFHSFHGLALPEKQFAPALRLFAELPVKDLLHLAGVLKRPCGQDVPGRWIAWLDTKGQKALMEALATAEWVYAEEHKNQQWIFASAVGLAMLDLAPPPPMPVLPEDFKVLPSFSVFAGAGRPLEQLLPLFQYCRIKKIAPLFEFGLEPKRLADTPAGSAASEELRRVLSEAGPLPTTIAATLEPGSSLSGVLKVRGCSAIVKPPTPEMLDAIRQHPRLKGYLEPKPPPGYLLIKPTSDPHNFLTRCRELGFTIEML